MFFSKFRFFFFFIKFSLSLSLLFLFNFEQIFVREFEKMHRMWSEKYRLDRNLSVYHTNKRHKSQIFCSFICFLCFIYFVQHPSVASVIWNLPNKSISIEHIFSLFDEICTLISPKSKVEYEFGFVFFHWFIFVCTQFLNRKDK